MATDLRALERGLDFDELPALKERDPNLPHAPVRVPELSAEERRLALKNALRYFDVKFHRQLIVEFNRELQEYGHIYMYRLLPDFELRAYPIGAYPAKCRHCAAIMMMIMNNLDVRVAQYPQELVTYGGNGQVFSNWAQFWLTMKYLSSMSDHQTLSMYSGHPLGVFPSSPQAPRLVITNGMVVPNYSSRALYEKLFALGCTMYGQMTAGSYCYIGPQGIVHGTTITLMNAGRKYLGFEDLRGRVFVTSGLGGMSGAQAKAAVICGCIGVVAEVSKEAIYKRHRQGWLSEVSDNLDQLIERIRKARANCEIVSIGYHGNVVSLWERLWDEYERTGEILADLGSDQTSCHNPHMGGYYPVQLSYDAAQVMMHEDPAEFKRLVSDSLRRQITAINRLAGHAQLQFWDYGNAFLLEAARAGCEVLRIGQRLPDGQQPLTSNPFIYPSYVQDIMGDIFSLGFGPFRWVCSSGLPDDLQKTDAIALEVQQQLLNRLDLPECIKAQYRDNIKWISEAQSHHLVVGSEARILYADSDGRVAIATAFNNAVASGHLKGPVVLSRDHHDVSGTDSPFRETSNIYDGSAFCADMAVQNCIGNSFRGATWVALHNGGGCGWGEVINGGFGMVLDGSSQATANADSMLKWDVNNGVVRRYWSGNDNASLAVERFQQQEPLFTVTKRHIVDADVFSLLE